MDELVNLVAKKTGLPKEQAKVAVDTVVGYLKKKLPKPIAGQVDAVLSGVKASDVENVMKGAMSLLGQATKKKPTKKK